MSWTSNPFKKLLVSEERSTFKSLAKRIGSLGDLDLQMEVLKLMTGLAEEIKALPSPLFDESQQHQFDSIGMAPQLKRMFLINLNLTNANSKVWTFVAKTFQMANQEENDVFTDFNLGSHSMTIENGRTRFIKVWEEQLKKVELKRSKTRDSIEMTVQEASSEELVIKLDFERNNNLSKKLSEVFPNSFINRSDETKIWIERETKTGMINVRDLTRRS
jgi:hypothetical protein